MQLNTVMNKDKLKLGINTIAEKVANRGIYITNKEQNGLFFVQEHITKKVLNNNIPIKQVADNLCKIYNKGKTLPSHKKIELSLLIERYFKFENDIAFYKNTLKTTKDSVKYYTTIARYKDAVKHFQKIRESLINF